MRTKIYFKLKSSVDPERTQAGLPTTSNSDCVITLTVLSVTRLSDTLAFEETKQIIFYLQQHYELLSTVFNWS